MGEKHHTINYQQSASLKIYLLKYQIIRDDGGLPKHVGSLINTLVVHSFGIL